MGVLAGLLVAAQPFPAALAAEGDVVVVDSTDVPVVVTAPYPPGQVEAVARASGATVTWLPPEDDGGEAITGYLVQLSADDGVTWTGAPDAGPDTTSSVIDGLDNGTSYVFQVAAVSSAGVGGWSEPSEPVTPQDVPNRPTVVAGVPGDSRVIVTWVPPADDGGSAITGYLVDYSTDMGASWRPASPDAVAGASA